MGGTSSGGGGGGGRGRSRDGGVRCARCRDRHVVTPATKHRPARPPTHLHTCLLGGQALAPQVKRRRAVGGRAPACASQRRCQRRSSQPAPLPPSRGVPAGCEASVVVACPRHTRKFAWPTRLTGASTRTDRPPRAHASSPPSFPPHTLYSLLHPSPAARRTIRTAHSPPQHPPAMARYAPLALALLLLAGWSGGGARARGVSGGPNVWWDRAARLA